MMGKNKMAPGQKAFLETLPTKVREAGTENANMDCENCGQRILLVGPRLVSMNVFTYPDAPHFTTKALCFNCCNKALKEHGGTQIPQVLN